MFLVRVTAHGRKAKPNRYIHFTSDASSRAFRAVKGRKDAPSRIDIISAKIVLVNSKNIN